MYLKETVVSKQKSHFFSRNASLARFPEARGVSSDGGSSSAKRWGPNYVAEKIKCKCKGRTGSWESLDFTLKWKTSEKGETACSLGLSCCSCDGLSASHSTLLLLYFFFLLHFVVFHLSSPPSLSLKWKSLADAILLWHSWFSGNFQNMKWKNMVYDEPANNLG